MCVRVCVGCVMVCDGLCVLGLKVCENSRGCQRCGVCVWCVSCVMVCVRYVMCASSQKSTMTLSPPHTLCTHPRTPLLSAEGGRDF